MKKILFIGNSYTYYNGMPTEIFAKMCESAGISVSVRAITKGGESLLGHATEGHPRYDEIEEAFASEHFDYLILQEQSNTPAVKREAYFEGLEHFIKKGQKNGATVFLYGTWRKKEGHNAYEKYSLTKGELSEKLNDAFSEAAKIYGVGVAFVDPPFIEAENTPNLPDPYNEDGSHPTYVGSFIAALTIIKTIFGISPTDIPFTGELSPEIAEKLKKIASK
ncbi:MAG: hypothetical protein E7641_08270 [Ruminococcaceae bacterium]|nr:hypothetical protein [Oscillospiraceae bacterium]